MFTASFGCDPFSPLSAIWQRRDELSFKLEWGFYNTADYKTVRFLQVSDTADILQRKVSWFKTFNCSTFRVVLLVNYACLSQSTRVVHLQKWSLKCWTAEIAIPQKQPDFWPSFVVMWIPTTTWKKCFSQPNNKNYQLSPIALSMCKANQNRA